MTKDKALELLDAAPYTSDPSRVNPGLTQIQAVDIIRNGLTERAIKADGNLIDMYEKRVWQVNKNQRRPNY